MILIKLEMKTNSVCFPYSNTPDFVLYTIWSLHVFINDQMTQSEKKTDF
jgi:hypothetical protein